jgi:hypothetical protein
MHSHLAEVVAEARLHEGTGGLIERLAGRAQDFVYDGWDYLAVVAVRGFSLNRKDLLFFRIALGTFWFTRSLGSAVALALQHGARSRSECRRRLGYIPCSIHHVSLTLAVYSILLHISKGRAPTSQKKVPQSDDAVLLFRGINYCFQVDRFNRWPLYTATSTDGKCNSPFH